MKKEDIQQEIRIFKLLDELEHLPGGPEHIRTCPRCRLVRRYMKGSTKLDKAYLGVYEAHLLAVLALYRH